MRVFLGSCDVTRTAITPIMRAGERRTAVREEGARTRLLDGPWKSRGCFVTVFFAPSHETPVFCLPARREVARLTGKLVERVKLKMVGGDTLVKNEFEMSLPERITGRITCDDRSQDKSFNTETFYP